MIKPLLTIVLSTLILSANPYQSSEEDLKQVKKIGTEISAKVLQTLGKKLKQHLKKDGLIEGAKFCSLNAYDLTNEIDKKYGDDVHVKRISTKYRNMANAPTEDESKILNAIATLNEEEVILPPYFIEQVNRDTYKYYKPLVISKGICLECHGDIKKGKAITTFIDKAYPHDKARGYKIGDMRGAVLVTIKK